MLLLELDIIKNKQVNKTLLEPKKEFEIGTLKIIISSVVDSKKVNN